MALNTSRQSIIERRREIVASLRLRGFSQRQIMHALSDPEKGVLNPTTGEPFSLGTINSDLQALEEQWREGAQQEVIEYKARALSELEELKRVAWKDKNYELVRRCIADIRSMMGADAPTTMKHTGSGKDGEFEFNVHDKRDEIQRKLASIATAAGATGLPGEPDGE